MFTDVDTDSILGQVADQVNEEMDNQTDDSGDANPDNLPDDSDAELQDDSTTEDGDEVEPQPDAEDDSDSGDDEVAEVGKWHASVKAWEKSRNPADLVGTPFEGHVNQMWNYYNQRIQEAVEAQRTQATPAPAAQAQPQPETRAETPPEIDYSGTEAEIKAATERRLAWEREQTMAAVREQIAPVQESLTEVRRRQQNEQVHADLVATPGFTAEVNAELGVLYAEVNPKNEAGHWFNSMIVDPIGRPKLIRMAQERLDKKAAPQKASAEEKIKKATKASKGAIPRVRAKGGKSETEPPKLNEGSYDTAGDRVLDELSRLGYK